MSAPQVDPITAVAIDLVTLLLEARAHMMEAGDPYGPVESLEVISLEDGRALGVRAVALVRGERYVVDLLGMSWRHADDVELPDLPTEVAP